MIQAHIQTAIKDALGSLGVPSDMLDIKLDHPSDAKLGDYSTNVAMILARQLGASVKTPFDLAKKIADQLNADFKKNKSEYIERVEAVAPGFINFFLTKQFFLESIEDVLDKTAWYGKTTGQWNKKIIIEYTDPNPFKPFHIGHLMSNAIGESLSRIFEFQGAKITRANYGGDVGLHVAKAIWGIKKMSQDLPQNPTPEQEIEFIGKAYVAGSEIYETDEAVQKEIQELNKKIFEKTDPEIQKIYEWGKAVSIKHFEHIYRKLGSRFDYQFFESEVAEEGINIVMTWLERGVFEQSQGAIIFPGEKHGLHNRVFINSQGLPTYEAKELGLTKKKFELHDFDTSIVITANEQNDYFSVVEKAISLMYPTVAERMLHISHGMMRFASGKMSSRKGNIITGESLISDIEAMVFEKIKDREGSESEKKDIAEKVALGAIKYSILRQSTGKDIIFDPEKSVSFEGDSGPYIQYTYVRIKSILAKAVEEGIVPEAGLTGEDETPVERLIYKFPEIVERAAVEKSPNLIATYLIQLAGEFNAYYAHTKIVDKKDKLSPQRAALAEAVGWVLKDGLWLLGIETPSKM